MLLVCSECPGCLIFVFSLLPGAIEGYDCLTCYGKWAAGGESRVECRKVEVGFWNDMDKASALLLLLVGILAGLKFPYLVNSYLYYLLMKNSVCLWTVSAKSASMSSSLFILAIFLLASFLYFSILLTYQAQTGYILANFISSNLYFCDDKVLTKPIGGYVLLKSGGNNGDRPSSSLFIAWELLTI